MLATMIYTFNGVKVSTRVSMEPGVKVRVTYV